MKTDDVSQTGQKGKSQRWIAGGVAILVLCGIASGVMRLSNKQQHTPATTPVSDAPTEAAVIPVEGMSCSACVANLKRALKATPGVREAHVSQEKKEAEVRFDGRQMSPDKLAKVVDEAGYKAGTPRPMKSGQ